MLCNIALTRTRIDCVRTHFQIRLNYTHTHIQFFAHNNMMGMYCTHHIVNERVTVRLVLVNSFLYVIFGIYDKIRRFNETIVFVWCTQRNRNACGFIFERDSLEASAIVFQHTHFNTVCKRF